MKTKFDNILFGFVVKSVFLSVLVIMLLTVLFSKFVMMFDLDSSYCMYLGYLILFITTFVVGGLSTFKFKNSLILMCILSNIPTLILSVINSAINKSIVQFFICVIIIIIGSIVASVFNAKKSRKLKV